MDPRGTIVVNAKAGRALRQSPRDVGADDVLYAVGAFSSGDRVWVVVRGGDGGQGVFATAVAESDAASCVSLTPCARDLRLIWPPRA